MFLSPCLSASVAFASRDCLAVASPAVRKNPAGEHVRTMTLPSTPTRLSYCHTLDTIRCGGSARLTTSMYICSTHDEYANQNRFSACMYLHVCICTLSACFVWFISSLVYLEGRIMIGWAWSPLVRLHRAFGGLTYHVFGNTAAGGL